MSFNISFKEGESYKFGLQIVGIEDVERVTVSFVTAHSVLFKKFTTTDDSITDEGDGLYTVAFADQDSIKKHGIGKWQIEIESTSLGVRKSSVYRYEVMQSVVNRTTETPVVATAINQTFTWDFEVDNLETSSTAEAFTAVLLAMRKTINLSAVANDFVIQHNMNGVVNAFFFDSSNNRDTTINYEYVDANNIKIKLPEGGASNFTGKVTLLKL